MKGLRVLELSEALNVDSSDLLAVCAILKFKATSRLSMLSFEECNAGQGNLTPFQELQDFISRDSNNLPGHPLGDTNEGWSNYTDNAINLYITECIQYNLYGENCVSSLNGFAQRGSYGSHLHRGIAIQQDAFFSIYSDISEIKNYSTIPHELGHTFNLNHVWKHDFKVPFVCGCRNLGEALRRIAEGAALIRTKGEAGSGNIVEAVRHLRSILGDIRKITQADQAELFDWAKKLQAPIGLIQEVAETGSLPVPMFCAGGIATPADASLVMQLGAEAVFVGSGIFKSEDPAPRAKAIVEATTHFQDPAMIAKVSSGLGDAMPGLEIGELETKLSERGW